MNKKQRNRKLVTQNRRNKLINRRYTSTIKTFSKLITKKIKLNNKLDNFNNKKKLVLAIVFLPNDLLFSILDGKRIQNCEKRIKKTKEINNTNK